MIMILTSFIEIVIPIIFFTLIVLFFLFRYIAKYKRKKMLEGKKYIKYFFDNNKELYNTQYLPCKNKPLNRQNSEIFLAESFCLILQGFKIKRINYKDIYWVYGMTTNRNKNSKFYFEALVINTIYGKYTIYLKNQLPYVKYFNNLNILVGYNQIIKNKALGIKRMLKNERRTNKKI